MLLFSFIVLFLRWNTQNCMCCLGCRNNKNEWNGIIIFISPFLHSCAKNSWQSDCHPTAFWMMCCCSRERSLRYSWVAWAEYSVGVLRLPFYPHLQCFVFIYIKFQLAFYHPVSQCDEIFMQFFLRFITLDNFVSAQDITTSLFRLFSKHLCVSQIPQVSSTKLWMLLPCLQTSSTPAVPLKPCCLSLSAFGEIMK